MNVEFINPFLSAMLNVLATMAQTEATPGKPYIKKDSKARGDVTGIVGLAGKQAKGSLAISFSKEAILHIAAKMLGEPATDFNSEIADVVGEITNMVSGGAKKILADQGFKFAMAIPTTIMGNSHSITHSASGPVILIPFEIEQGGFFIEVCLESSEKS